MRSMEEHPFENHEESYKTVIRQKIAEIDLDLEHRLASVKKFFSKDIVWHSPTKELKGHKALRDYYVDMENVF